MTIKSSIYKATQTFKDTQEAPIIEKALSGDIKIVCSPATTTRAATSAAFSRDIEVRLEALNGNLHGWYNGTLTVAVADTSTAGTATIAGGVTTVTLKNGVGTITLNGSAAAWIAADTNTLTVSKNTSVPVLTSVADATSVESII